VKYQKGLIVETLTFLSTTPQTGVVTVKVGAKTMISLTLPEYGKCPPAKDGG